MDPVKIQEIIDREVRLLFTTGDIVFKISNSEDISEEATEINLSLLLKFILTEAKLVKMNTVGDNTETTASLEKNKRVRTDE